MPQDGTVDASIYNRLIQPPASPIDTIGQFAGIQNQLNQNRQFQMQFAANRAWGQIFQQSVDPTTGTTDWGKAITLGASNPATGWDAPRMAGLVAQKQLLDQQTLGASLKNSRDQYQSMLEMVGPLADKLKDPNVTNDQLAQEATGKIGDMWAAGLLGPTSDPQSRQRALSYITQLDPTKIRQQIYMFQQQAAGAADSFDKTLGAVVPTSTGSGTTFPRVSAVTGVTPGGFQPNALSPADANALVPIQATSQAQADQLSRLTGQTVHIGDTITAPRSAIYGQSTGNAPAFLQPWDATQPTSQQSAISGQQPAGGTTPTLNQMPAAGSAPPQQTGGIGQVTKMGPAQTQYQTELGTGAGQYKVALDDNASQWSQVLPHIQQMIQASQKAYQGGGATIFKDLAQAAQGLGVDPATVDKIAGGSLSASQMLDFNTTSQVFSNLRNLINGAGRFAVLEFNVLKDKSPGIDSDPRMLGQFLNFTNFVGNLKLKEQNTYQKYVAAGRDPTQFPVWWNNMLVKSNALKYTGLSDKDVSGIASQLQGGQ